MDLLLKMKHWQIFMLLLLAAIASDLSWTGHELLTLMINVLGVTVYYVWYFAVGLELSEQVPKKVGLPKTFFIINGFVVVLSFLALVGFFDGQYQSTGLLGFLWVAYLLYAICQFHLYPGKALKSVEMNKEARIGDYFGYFLLMIFWPIGIWFTISDPGNC